MTIKKISIISLTYNNWRLLEKAIKSVSTQKIDERYKIEYIISDDGTEDFNYEHVKKILESTLLKFNIIVNESNIGTVASFNNAIKHAEGDIIIPLSADDEFYDEYVVNEIINAFENKDMDIITTLRVPVINEVELQAIPSKEKVKLFNSSEKLLRELLFSNNIISGASTYYRRSVFTKIGFFDEKYRLLEDYPFYIKALILGVNIDFLNIKSIKYGVNGVSSNNVVNPALREDYKKLNLYILNLPLINIIDFRGVSFKKIMTRKERYKNAWKYPDQLFLMLLKKWS
ncbi:glycosyltransferase [Agarivorans sp. QJM3NY_33]|uniref:glycosyltransferase n=1 Tax=Agarivorans sp. QJM3NY_33 TaxID=3421432 RepID=UPI003D7ED297